MPAGDDSQDAEDAADATAVARRHASQRLKRRRVVEEDPQAGRGSQFPRDVPAQGNELGDAQCVAALVQTLAARGGLNEVELDRAGTQCLGHPQHGLRLAGVPSHERVDNLGPDARGGEIDDRASRRLKRAWDTTHPVVGLRIRSVDAHRYETPGAASDVRGDRRRAEQTVGLDRHSEVVSPDDLQQPCEVRVQQRLAAGELDAAQTQRKSLTDGRVEQLDRQRPAAVAGWGEPGCQPTMPARQVAVFGQIEVQRLDRRSRRAASLNRSHLARQA